MIQYQSVTSFPQALRTWEGRPYPSLPTKEAPPGYLPGCREENAALAEIFAKLAALPTNTDRAGLLMLKIEAYKRHVRLYEGTLRGESNPARVGMADRSHLATIRAIEAMIDALEQWRDDLHEAWMNEIGVGFIEQAARVSA